MSTKRKAPDLRRDEIVLGALPLAAEHGYAKITRDQIGEAVGISGQAVMYHFKTMAQLRRTIMRAAVRTECLPVIAQGLTAKDAQAFRASEALQEKSLRYVLTNGK